MAEPSGSPISSYSPPSERLSKELFPELPKSLEDQNIELAIFLSVQPLSSRPPPTFNSGSSTDLGPESPDNLVRTPKNSSTTDGQLGLVIYPPNPLFDVVEISSQHPYSLYDQLGVPLELFPNTRSTIRHHLFSDMELEGDAPDTSPDESEVSTPHAVEGEELQLQFPPEAFPYSEGIPASFPPGCVSLGHSVLGIPSALSLYNNFVWASGIMPMSGPFITNMTSQPIFTSVPVQPTISNTLISSILVMHQSQPTVSKIVSASSSVPLVSGQIVPPLGGQNLIVPMVSGATNVSGSQAHMLGINQPSFGIIYNLADPTRSSNVQYQQVKNPGGPSSSSNVQYQ